MSAVVLSNIRFQYDAATPLLENLSLEIPAGSMVLLTGRNGTGKSTLFRLLSGILQPVSGTVTISDIETTKRTPSAMAPHICMTFQNPGDQIFATTVRDEIAFAPKNLRRASVDTLVNDAAAMCGLSELMDEHPYDCSLAQRKLLTIASAVASGSPVLAFDEPSANLSFPERERLISCFRTLKQQGRTVIIISHDLDVFLPLVDRVLVLAGGAIRFDNVPRAVVGNASRLRSAGVRLPLVYRLFLLAETEPF